jgi:hypothetical protein
VLVAGGIPSGAGVLGSAELYDPGTGNWSATVNMVEPRFLHTAALLSSGRVLVVGGVDSNDVKASVELYDPGSGN